MLKKTTMMVAVLGLVAMIAMPQMALAGGNGAGGPVSLQGSWVLFAEDEEIFFSLTADGGPNDGTVNLEIGFHDGPFEENSLTCQGTSKRTEPGDYIFTCAVLVPYPVPVYAELHVDRDEDGDLLYGYIAPFTDVVGFRIAADEGF